MICFCTFLDVIITSWNKVVVIHTSGMGNALKSKPKLTTDVQLKSYKVDS